MVAVCSRNNVERRQKVYDKVYAAGYFFMIWIRQTVGFCAVSRGGVGRVSMPAGGSWDVVGSVERTRTTHRPTSGPSRASTQFRHQPMGGDSEYFSFVHPDEV